MTQPLTLTRSPEGRGNRTLSRRTVRFLAICWLLVVLPGVAAAASLEELRASGVVGERFDGIAVVRKEGAADVRSLVDSVNAKRRKIYEEHARKEGVDAKEVGKVYALEIAGKAPSGTWFLGEDGKWVRKE